MAQAQEMEDLIVEQVPTLWLEKEHRIQLMQSGVPSLGAVGRLVAAPAR